MVMLKVVVVVLEMKWREWRKYYTKENTILKKNLLILMIIQKHERQKDGGNTNTNDNVRENVREKSR